MKRKLLLLNAALLGVCVLAASELYRQWILAEDRVANLDTVAPDAIPPVYPDPPARATLRAGDYLPVVDRMLFSADRNAIVEVQVEEVVPEERPDLPHMSGLVDFGDGPQALMAAGGGEAKWIGVGDQVGDFVFAGVDEGDKIKLTWKEEEIVVERAKLAEAPKPKRKTAKAANAAPAASGAQSAAASPNLTAPAEAAKTVGGKHNIGAEFAPGRFRADPGDGADDGTEYQGYVKRVRRTPFGSQAWWEKK